MKSNIHHKILFKHLVIVMLMFVLNYHMMLIHNKSFMISCLTYLLRCIVDF